jgi:hypothetical protein
MTHTEFMSIVKNVAKETAIEVLEMYQKHGDLIGRSGIIREIGKALYDQGVIDGKLNPVRKSEGIKGKKWIQTKEYLRFKAEMFDDPNVNMLFQPGGYYDRNNNR